MAELEIREEAAGDADAISAVQEAAFGQPNEARLVDALRDAAHPRVSLVATRGGRLVGHVLVSPVTIDEAPDGATFGGLGPVGVEPARQGGGIGGALVRAALERSRAVGFRAVFLVGNPRYYERFGFALAAPRGLHYPNPAHDPFLQVRELAPGALDGCAGTVRFPAAFDAFE